MWRQGMALIMPAMSNPGNSSTPPATMLLGVWDAVRWHAEQMFEQFNEHDCLARAGALTYTTLFAVVPMMTVAYAMFSIMPVFEGVAERVQGFVFDNFVPDSSAAVQNYLSEFTERARGLTVVGFGFLFVTAFLMLVTIEKTLNVIWRVKEPRRGLQRFLLYWGVMSLGPPLIGAGILISIYLVSLPLFVEFDTYGIGQVLLGYLPLLLTAVGFTVVFYAVPNCAVPLRHAMAGGLLTMLLFEAAKRLFTAVVTNTSIQPIYGTFAAIPFFLAWLYMVWVLVLGGAIFVHTLSLTRQPEAGFGEPLLIKCARVLDLLHQAHMQGRDVSEEDIGATVRMTGSERARMFAVLEELRLLRVTEAGHWSLGRNLKSLTLWDLYQQLPEGVELSRLEAVRDLDGVVEPLKALVQFGSNQMSISLDTVFTR